MLPDSAPLVVATDLSACSGEAYAYALRVARASGAMVHLLHVAAEADAAADEALEAFAGTLDAPGGVVRTVRAGDAPAVVAREVAVSVGAALVVVGACGRRARRRLLGSVAAEVLHTAPCDVLLVPPRDGEPQPGEPRDGASFATLPLDRVLVAVDLSAASPALAAFGATVARALGATGVDLVHVLEPLPHPVRWIDETLLALLPEIGARAEAALRDLAAATPALNGLDVALYVERGKAAATVPRVAEALGDALVVVGPHAGTVLGGITDRLLGSTAEGVARRAACPVWVAGASAQPGASFPDSSATGAAARV